MSQDYKRLLQIHERLWQRGDHSHRYKESFIFNQRKGENFASRCSQNVASGITETLDFQNIPVKHGSGSP